MLKELEEGIAQISDEGGFGDADFLYNGDPGKWRRFGYSMMLRLGMRMSEVDAGEAQKWVEKAIQGGVLQMGEDAFIEHTNGPEGINRNGIGEVLDIASGNAGEHLPTSKRDFRELDEGSQRSPLGYHRHTAR